MAALARSEANGLEAGGPQSGSHAIGSFATKTMMEHSRQPHGALPPHSSCSSSSATSNSVKLTATWRTSKCYPRSLPLAASGGYLFTLGPHSIGAWQLANWRRDHILHFNSVRREAEKVEEKWQRRLWSEN